MTDFKDLAPSQPSTEPTPAEPPQGEAAPTVGGPPSLFQQLKPLLIPLLLLNVLAIGAYLRLMNVDWDEGEHLHPDERHTTMVSDAIRWPGPSNEGRTPPEGCAAWGGYFDSYCSPLNPQNRGYSGYAYGTLPIFSARWVGEWLNQGCLDPSDPDATPSRLPRFIGSRLFDDAEGCTGNYFATYWRIYLLGRMLSALADLGTILFTFAIGRRLYGSWVGLLAATLYAFSALPIQQSHFYAVDSFAGFFITAAGFFVVRAAQGGRWRDFVLSGLGFGLALACKASVWPFAAIIALAAVLYYVRGKQRTRRTKSLILDGLMVLLLLIFFFLVVTIAMFGIWSAVKLAFYFAVALLFCGGVALYLLRPGARRPGPGIDGALMRVLLAGLVAFIAFRVAQPYAFVGANFEAQRLESPDYDWLRRHLPDSWYKLNDNLPEPLRALLLPDPRFISTLASVNEQLTGEADVPWGHQWTNRLPFIFPWVNMVFWGMGLPLGLTVWAAWALVAWELWRGKRRLQHFIPWAWATALFFYQGTQWVKSIRYLLAIYPFLILLGAWLLFRLWQRANPLRRAKRSFVLLVLAGAFLWAWGFTRIYARPVTRNTASRWMFENIPTAATLHYEAAGESQTHFLRLSPTHVYTPDMDSLIVNFTMPQDGLVTGITFTHLGDPWDDATPETFQALLSSDDLGQQVLTQAEQTLHLEQAHHRLGDAQHFALPPVALQGEQGYYLTTRVTAGAPVQLHTTVIANEYPDDSLPTRVDGNDPFGGMYRGLRSSGDSKTHWDLGEDVAKLFQAVEWLDEADIIALSSNRGYASVPRLPARYPMAITYYRELFAERLGFELIATFTSYPTIGPFQFPDQETPFPPGEPSLIHDETGSISVYLPPAEEAFSVYDHPQVFLFRKTPAYSRQRVEAILGQVNLSKVVWMKPTEATLAPTAFQLNGEELRQQREGGTWSDIFDPGDWLNRSPLLSVVVWWMLVQVLGLVAFPLLFVAAPGLRDRGWPLAKTLGLLLLATITWLLASSFAGPTYSRLTIFGVLLLLTALGGALAWWQRRELLAWADRERRNVLVSELAFSGMFLAFLLIRYGNPDLWHPAMGGERPMDFAFLNAVIKSTHFPPYDPWLAGDYLNYYYYGFVIAATPIKLLGILPEIAYNLLLPTFFALAGAGAYSAAYNLASQSTSLWRRPSPPTQEQPDSQSETNGENQEAEDKNQEIPNPTPTCTARRRKWPRSRDHSTQYPISNTQSLIPIYAGLIAALFVMVLGNMGEIGLVSNGLQELGARDFEFQSTIPGLEALVVRLRGLKEVVLEGEAMPWRPEWPYWNASRAIPHPPEEATPITEFPFFTFLYSDLHAHLMALPLTLLVLGIALNWAFDADFWWLHVRASALRRRRWFAALLGLALGGVALGALYPTNTWDYVTYLALTPLALTIGYVAHQVGSQNFKLNFETLRDGALSIGGRFTLLAALSYLFYLPYLTHFATASKGFELWKGSKTPLWAYFGVHGLFLLPIATWLLLKVQGVIMDKAQEWLHDSDQPISVLGPLAVFGLALVVLFALILGYAVALVVLPFGTLTLLVLLTRTTRPAERMVALLSGVGLALTLWVEVMVLNQGDVGRMNTVFKFYLQTWVLFGVCAAVCLSWIIPRLPRFHVGWRAWIVVLALLVVCAGLYPILATRAKINDRWARQIGSGLDSMAWMKAVQDQYGQLKWEYQALMWLRENVDGSPVVAEGARAQTYRSQRARVATYTGLPIVIGYPWHSQQQRTFLQVDVVGRREHDVNQLFDTTDLWLAKEILERYDVSLVYVGTQERGTYPAEGIAKFEQMSQIGLLRPIYANAEVTIYQVVSSP
jgi:YYY domain-containing protein